MARPPIKRVSKGELRSIFNRLYLADVLAGQLTEIIASDGRANPRMNQPAGTRSQIAHYFDAAGRKVAIVHQYVLPDCTYGGSGKPDPKMVLDEHGICHAAPVTNRPPRPPRKRSKPKKGR
jgi:hypothetical protein